MLQTWVKWVGSCPKKGKMGGKLPKKEKKLECSYHNCTKTKPIKYKIGSKAATTTAALDSNRGAPNLKYFETKHAANFRVLLI